MLSPDIPLSFSHLESLPHSSSPRTSGAPTSSSSPPNPPYLQLRSAKNAGLRPQASTRGCLRDLPDFGRHPALTALAARAAALAPSCAVTDVVLELCWFQRRVRRLNRLLVILLTEMFLPSIFHSYRFPSSPPPFATHSSPSLFLISVNSRCYRRHYGTARLNHNHTVYLNGRILAIFVLCRRLSRWRPTLAIWGVGAGVAVALFMSDVPLFQKDVLKKIPVVSPRIRSPPAPTHVLESFADTSVSSIS